MTNKKTKIYVFRQGGHEGAIRVVAIDEHGEIITGYTLATMFAVKDAFGFTSRNGHLTYDYLYGENGWELELVVGEVMANPGLCDALVKLGKKIKEQGLVVP